MNLRVALGSLLSFTYNAGVGHLPSRRARSAFLRKYLLACGEGTSVQRGCRFLNGRKVALGERNVVNFGCLIDGRVYRVETGNDVSIGPAATILTLGHDPQSPTFEDKGGPVTIGARVWIAYGAVIMPGVTIGEGAVVAAHAVVTRDVEPYTIVAGSPAKKIGERARDLNYQLEHSPWLL